MITVINAQTLGFSEYSTTVIDMVSLNNTAYFLTVDGGIMALNGTIETDSGIATGDLSFVPGSTCNVSRAYLDVGSDAKLILEASASSYGAVKTDRYVIPVRTGDESRARTVPLGKGPRGVDWTLKIGASSGAWTLKSLEVVPERVSRLR